ncbi:MAG: hypothetical protein WDW38_010390 [Sanguina aurantia]
MLSTNLSRRGVSANTVSSRSRTQLQIVCLAPETRKIKGLKYDGSNLRWVRDERYGSMNSYTVQPKTGIAYTVWPVVHTVLTEKKLKRVTVEEAHNSRSVAAPSPHTVWARARACQRPRVTSVSTPSRPQAPSRQSVNLGVGRERARAQLHGPTHRPLCEAWSGPALTRRLQTSDTGAGLAVGAARRPALAGALTTCCTLARAGASSSPHTQAATLAARRMHASAMSTKGWTLVDVRAARDYELEHAEGAVNVPLYRPVAGNEFWDVLKRVAMAGFAMQATERNPDFVEVALEKLRKNEKIIIMCNIGGTLETLFKPSSHKKGINDPDRAFGRESRSLKAAYEIIEAGGWNASNVVFVEGGVQMWRHRGFPVV